MASTEITRELWGSSLGAQARARSRKVSQNKFSCRSTTKSNGNEQHSVERR